MRYNLLDLKPPVFVMIPDDKGDNMVKPKEYDPEGDTEDKWLKNIGATLKAKKIQV